LWRSWEYKEIAASALKLTATDMKKLKLIDEIVREPAGGAHANREKTFDILKNNTKLNFEVKNNNIHSTTSFVLRVLQTN
jgi:acetyl-CoA carboxylase carboxyl transferase subunit alpha